MNASADEHGGGERETLGAVVTHAIPFSSRGD